jgi:hypothetical protein
VGHFQSEGDLDLKQAKASLVYGEFARPTTAHISIGMVGLAMSREPIFWCFMSW